MAISFEKEIKPLFRTKDVNSMSTFGGFNLHNYDDVKERAESILERLSDGTMPCDGVWPKSDIDLFSSWIEQGKLP